LFLIYFLMSVRFGDRKAETKLFEEQYSIKERIRSEVMCFIS